jgi:DNA (cytosine-5)-methyltransferase 1
MDAAETYHTNFPDCSVWPTSVDIFLNAGQSEEEMRVDVMHLSPPCQPFSSAHTIDGKDDEDNEAAMLCIELCLRRSRPRFVTMEETDGVLNPKHQGNFISAVSSLIDCGYSVHWKVLNCKNFGVPCQRRRFFLIAAR